MDQSSLHRLAKQGLRQLPPSSLPDLAEWCWDSGETSGDARYCSLSRTLNLIWGTFEPHGAASRELVDALDQLLSTQLTAVIQADTAELGALRILPDGVIRRRQDVTAWL
jgi:hypothetical protein